MRFGIAFVLVLEYNIVDIIKGVRPVEVMSAKEAANKWGISQRRVAILCSENRIPQAQIKGKNNI